MAFVHLYLFHLCKIVFENLLTLKRNKREFISYKPCLTGIWANSSLEISEISYQSPYWKCVHEANWVQGIFDRLYLVVATHLQKIKL